MDVTSRSQGHWGIGRASEALLRGQLTSGSLFLIVRRRQGAGEPIQETQPCKVRVCPLGKGCDKCCIVGGVDRGRRRRGEEPRTQGDGCFSLCKISPSLEHCTRGGNRATRPDNAAFHCSAGGRISSFPPQPCLILRRQFGFAGRCCIPEETPTK